jgi:ArpU family phage transcriptional regulator
MGTQSQIILSTYEVDTEATKAAVEKYLLQAREYMVTEYIPLETKVTTLYEPRYHGRTNAVVSQTESIAVANVDEMERRRRHVERVEKAVSRLGARQQKLIRMRYLDDDHVMDSEVAEALGYSTRHYRRLKSNAIYRLAAALGLIVLREE